MAEIPNYPATITAHPWHPRPDDTEPMDLDNPPSSSAQLQEASPEAQDILVPSDRYASTRRPTESIADFVARLPPVPTAARAVASPWYWVYGPTPTCTSTSSGSSSNNVPESVRAIAFRRQGERLLGRIKFGLDCNPGDARVHARLRAELQREIAALAREHGVTSGKVCFVISFLSLFGLFVFPMAKETARYGPQGRFF